MPSLLTIISTEEERLKIEFSKITVGNSIVTVITNQLFLK